MNSFRIQITYNLMKKVITAFAIILTASFCIHAEAAPAIPSQATSVKKGVVRSAKFLTVDVAELYGKYNKAIEAQKKFDEAAQNAQKEVNEMIQSGIKLGEEFKDFSAKANNPALTEAAKGKFLEQASAKAQQIEQKQMEISQYQQQASQTLAQRRQSVMNLHMNDMREVCSRIAKEKGADLVLNSTGILVMYHNEQTDITEEATTILNGRK